jgi:hypothetical protein
MKWKTFIQVAAIGWAVKTWGPGVVLSFKMTPLDAMALMPTPEVPDPVGLTQVVRNIQGEET